MHIPGGYHRLLQRIPQFQHRAVEVPQLLFVLGRAVFQHEPVVVNGLNLQEVIEGCNLLQLVPGLALDDGGKQLAGLAGRAQNQPFPVLHE